MYYARPSSSTGVASPLLRTDRAHRSQSNARLIAHERYRGWQFSVEQRRVGTTLPRSQYSVRISDPMADREEYLTGFASRGSAEMAARRRVDFMVDIHDPQVELAGQRRRAARLRRTQRRRSH